MIIYSTKEVVGAIYKIIKTNTRSWNVILAENNNNSNNKRRSMLYYSIKCINIKRYVVGTVSKKQNST